MEQPVSRGGDFREILYWQFVLKYLKKLIFSLCVKAHVNLDCAEFFLDGEEP